MQDNDWAARSKRVLAQGWTGTNSKRSTAYIENIYPTHVVRGESCYLWDDCGNKYIDFISGLGTNLLGYNHPKVQEAVQKQLEKGGPSYSFPSTLEIEVAEKIREIIPCAEKIRFMKTGNEATLAAVRIARAYTSKEYVLNDSYHGHGDLWTFLTKPALGVIDKFSILETSNEKWPIEPSKTACRILEPIVLDATDGRKDELAAIMAIDKKRQQPIIFDEIVSGFRVPKYCVANWWQIQPDLICLGKAIANGYPLSIVAGKQEIMDSCEYFISSTYSGEAMSLAACGAVMDILKEKSFDNLIYYGQKFCDRFNEVCKPIGSKIEGYGSRGQTNFYENENTVLLFQELCKARILFGRAFFWNFAHMEENVEERVLNVVSDAVQRVKSGKVRLEGKAPQPTFKR